VRNVERGCSTGKRAASAVVVVRRQDPVAVLRKLRRPEPDRRPSEGRVDEPPRTRPGNRAAKIRLNILTHKALTRIQTV
jgi:hypothetical protein